MRHALIYVGSLCQDDEGVQVIEYALLIGAVALSLLISMNAMTRDGGGYGQFITRLVTCITTPTCS